MNKNQERLPGSNGEHTLQKMYNTQESAKKFYDREVYDCITSEMELFISQQNMLFISTSDAKGECDSSFRYGEKGFVLVLDKTKILYPEFNGNGVMASLGNIYENPHIGLLFIDFFKTQTGLHINGCAKIIDSTILRDRVEKSQYEKIELLEMSFNQKQFTWVLIDVEEAYIHCSKNIPQLLR